MWPCFAPSPKLFYYTQNSKPTTIIIMDYCKEQSIDGLFSLLLQGQILLIFKMEQIEIDMKKGRCYYYCSIVKVTFTLFENDSKCLILAFSTNFCTIKIDLSGNTVWQQTSGFQKLAKIDHFGQFQWTFAHSTFCSFKIDLSGNTVWQHFFGFQKFALLTIFCIFNEQ